MMAGVKVEEPKLGTAFTNASPELQGAIKEIRNSYRGGRLKKMVQELDAVSASPELTPEQKKLIQDLMDEIKQVIEKMPNTPG